MQIGPYLKSIRLEKGYTITNVARRLGISPSLLSQIENEKITPSLQSLEDLLKFYAVNFSDFFMQVEQKRFIFVRESETGILESKEHGFKLKLLASKLQNNALESFVVDLYPGAQIEIATLDRNINGERIIYSMAGTIEAILDNNETFTIVTGDSLNFKSYVSCLIKNCASKNARFLLSGMPPILM
jgi:transcriptional regulator with XRE-family HTH domain